MRIALSADHAGFEMKDLLADGRADRGITVCGSGIGVAIAANRNPACRCAQVSEPLSASLARHHNDANAIALGARLIGIEMAKACVTSFLTSCLLYTPDAADERSSVELGGRR